MWSSGPTAYRWKRTWPTSSLSVGRVRVAGMTASYHGRQRQTRNNAGHEVYGGSIWSSCAAISTRCSSFRHPASCDARSTRPAAITQPRSSIIRAHYPRCNYDVAEGRDAAGARRCGVLEHSWRIGGASGAEIGALAAFHRDSSLRAVRASCVEVYGEFNETPGRDDPFSRRGRAGRSAHQVHDGRALCRRGMK